MKKIFSYYYYFFFSAFLKMSLQNFPNKGIQCWTSMNQNSWTLKNNDPVYLTYSQYASKAGTFIDALWKEIWLNILRWKIYEKFLFLFHLVLTLLAWHFIYFRDTHVITFFIILRLVVMCKHWKNKTFVVLWTCWIGNWYNFSYKQKRVFFLSE